jgi:hypothetical protein
MLAPSPQFAEFLECERPYRKTCRALHGVAKEESFATNSLDMFGSTLGPLAGVVPLAEERCWPMCRSEARYVAG